ncbi:type 4a pilus biogenesis protein PilO [Gloeobacter kilaueensis]|uniref:Tfp pilus assembly protein PilO n=1 Tax=Gloeobacter kilaueensis (strain ATCC BAA-2537 / CCAP 1431/1 / ULC 316 / JS1) TaxID=1183438 RepID=U5QEV0_GLOK1|nr:type 4a pilus biogenesis protein PilO [Gloeobacter kilaueensis]AGY57482.1 Tfp pilus assembly protein PilO [Gloeobacter kilaueensis JS1]
MSSTTRLFGIELDRRGISLLVGLGGMLVVGLIAAQITIPQYNRIADLDSQLYQKNLEQKSKQIELEQAPKLTAERARSARLLAAVTSLIPPADKLPSLLVDTTRLVRANRAELRQFTPNPTRAIPEAAGAANIQANSARIRLNGSFAEILALMRDIERLEALVRIENVTIKAAEDKSGTPAQVQVPLPGTPPVQPLTAEFDLTAYVLGKGAAPPPPAKSDR